MLPHLRMWSSGRKPLVQSPTPKHVRPGNTCERFENLTRYDFHVILLPRSSIRWKEPLRSESNESLQPSVTD